MEELPALLAKAREEHSKGNLFENNGPDLDNAADEDPEGDDLHEDEVQDGCTRAWDVKEAEGEEAPAEPSPLPAADVKEPVASAPEQALKIAKLMCKFLALRLAFENPGASDLDKAALSGSQLFCSTGLCGNEQDVRSHRSALQLSISLCPRDETGATGCPNNGGAINPADRQAGAQLPPTPETYPDN